MKKVNLLKALICTALCVMCMTGCGLLDNNNEETISIVDIDINDEKFMNTIYTVIREGDDSGSSYLIEGFMISPEDIYNRLEVKEKYICDNAIYIKIDSDNVKYLYRFQLNNEGLIKSYIKYEVED